MEREEISVLRAVLYTIKSRGRRTEPCETPKEEVYEDKKLL